MTVPPTAASDDRQNHAAAPDQRPADDLRTELAYWQERARRLEVVAERRRYSYSLQTALYRIADLSGSDVDIADFFAKLHAILRELIYAENLFVVLTDADQRKLSVVYYADTVDTGTDIARIQNLDYDSIAGTLTAMVLRTGDALFANEEMIATLEASGEVKAETSATEHCVDWLGCPLKIGQRLLGVLVVQSYDHQHRYRATDKKLLLFVSRHIAIAVDRKQTDIRLNQARLGLEQSVQERTGELRAANAQLENEIREREQSERIRCACYDIAEHSVASKDLHDFFSSSHQIIDRLMPAKNFFIALYDAKAGILSFPYFADEVMHYPDSMILSAEEAKTSPMFTARVIASGQPLLLDADAISQQRKSEAKARKIASAWLGVPLDVEGEIIGVLAVQSYDKKIRFGAADLALLEFVSSHIATAIQRRHDADALHQAHDELKTINNELEKRITERTQALTKTNAMLEQLLEQRKQISDKLAHDAYHDALTGLPNRSLLRERLEQCIKRHQRKKRLAYAVLFLDLDRFKIINDSLGHMTGDHMLCEVGQRLLQCVRPGDTVARLGGDEFCILLDEIDNQADIERICERILKRIASAYLFGEETVYTSTSIGITLSQFAYRTADAALRDADAAMYQAKAQGKNRYYFFDPSLHQSAVDRLKLESDLRHAITRNEIMVYYQPVVDLSTGRIRAFEALTRWQHPTLGMVSPAQFIPLAEETGLINDIGLFVLRESAKQIKEWIGQFAPTKLAVSVNLSGRQLSQRNFMTHLNAIMRSYALPPEALKLEITESILIHNFQSAQSFLAEIQKIGIEIMLDDFGTGYSSLNYLHQFPLDTVKIDRAFINRLTDNEKTKALLSGIRLLTRNLGLTLVAEGIETALQRDLVKELGIEFGQGYLFGAAMPAAQATQMLKADAKAAATVGVSAT